VRYPFEVSFHEGADNSVRTGLRRPLRDIAKPFPHTFINDDRRSSCTINAELDGVVMHADTDLIRKLRQPGRSQLVVEITRGRTHHDIERILTEAPGIQRQRRVRDVQIGKLEDTDHAAALHPDETEARHLLDQARPPTRSRRSTQDPRGR
jgi:hypothetical protein